MAVYTRRIVGPRFVPSSNTTLYTVPAGKAVVLRSIDMINSHPTAAGLIRSGIDGTSFVNLIFRATPAALSMSHYDVRLAMAAGESLVALCDLPSHISLAITAYVLDA